MITPTANDWAVVWNDLHTVLGKPPYEGPDFIPSDETINKLAEIYPGLPQALKENAQAQAEHRVWIEDLETKHQARMRRINQIAAGGIIVMVGLFLLIWGCLHFKLFP